MGDVDLIWEMTEAIRNDSEKPSIEQRFNPTDPVSIEIVLHETDFAVEAYMEKWRALYRGRFADPSIYDKFVLDWQMKCRRDMKTMIAEAQQFIAEELAEEEPEEGDEDGYERQD
jgi:hypothetical protein